MHKTLLLIALAAFVVAVPTAAAIPEEPLGHEPEWYCGKGSVDVWIEDRFVACVNPPN